MSFHYEGHGPSSQELKICSQVQHSKSQLVALKTTLETRAKESVITVYITSVPVKQANGTLDVIRKLIPNNGGLDLQHLRRFAKPEHVPETVRTAFIAAQDPLVVEKTPGYLFLIIGSTYLLPKTCVVEALSSTIDNLTICSIQVPLNAPTSQDQANRWTSTYWPTVYKKSNPFGPHPSIVAKAENEIRGHLNKWMDLAADVARESSTRGIGEAVGVVIVDRKNGIARPVAVAGDARWLDWPCKAVGNVTAHATLRAIAMVAEGLRSRDEMMGKSNIHADEVGIFRDVPILEAEKENYDTSNNETGYLCHELEIYCTHEPCVMCSMAIVHSRFGRVVFEKKMPLTGGLCADSELGHGLFWRKELNWTLLAWNYIRSDGVESSVTNLELNA